MNQKELVFSFLVFNFMIWTPIIYQELCRQVGKMPMNKETSKKPIKICFAASSGGHLEQILMLRPLMDKYDSFLITEKTSYRPDIKGISIYYLHQVNRKEISFPLEMMINTIKSFVVFFKEKPDVIISTGVLATIPICLIAKLFRKKLIYIESFAKVRSANATGRLLYRFADQFYVQWPQMLEIYPKAIYLGGIY